MNLNGDQAKLGVALVPLTRVKNCDYQSLNHLIDIILGM